MRMQRFALAAAVLHGVLCAAAAPMAAQEVVGRLPAQSTLQDLNDGQRFGAFADNIQSAFDITFPIFRTRRFGEEGSQTSGDGFDRSQ